MNIIGVLWDKDEAYEIEIIAKFSIVGERARYLGRISRIKKKGIKK